MSAHAARSGYPGESDPGFTPDRGAFPVAVTNHGASATLEIRWADGASSLLSHGLLRASCRCAACVALRRAHRPVADAAAAICLTHAEPVGQQGLNLVFSDGHGRGIFPWAYLRELGAAQPPAPEST